jgi:hypothetical protein
MPANDSLWSVVKMIRASHSLSRNFCEGTPMSDVIRLEDRKRKHPRLSDVPIIKKIVDGEVVECVDIDALPPEQQNRFIASE